MFKESISSIVTKYGTFVANEKIYELPQKEIEQIFTQIAKYRNMPILFSLLEEFSCSLTSSSYLSLYRKLIASDNIFGEPIANLKVLPLIYPSSWINQTTENTKKSKELLLDFLHTPSVKGSLRNQTTNLTQNLLLATIALDKDSSLSSFEKLKLLANVCSLKKDPIPTISDLEESLALIAIFCKKNQGDSLLNEDLSLNRLKELSEKSFITDSYADIEDIKNVIAAYKETFGSTQIPNALKTYEIGLKSLNDPDVQKDHTRFVRSVLLGNEIFKKERYRIDNNPNLRKIAEKRPDTFEKWQESLDSTTLPNNITIFETDDPITLFEAPTLAKRTCQSIDSSVSLNKCLISFCIDGGIRMVIAKDASKKTIAFQVLRIIQDTKGEPALLLEPLYSNTPNLEITKALETAALQKAKHIGCRLFTKSPRIQISPYIGSFKWEGGNCKYTYSDLIGGILTQGKTSFSIPNLKQITR
ncbi:MAG: hypothetical protein JSS09_00320 [Verrucomicrobia bacterium]|nr:hypothetical protein [Verrucomicrobiota bacterium]